jgi:hypothetical protein
MPHLFSTFHLIPQFPLFRLLIALSKFEYQTVWQLWISLIRWRMQVDIFYVQRREWCAICYGVFVDSCFYLGITWKV